jgi:hypothetical protein
LRACSGGFRPIRTNRAIPTSDGQKINENILKDFPLSYVFILMGDLYNRPEASATSEKRVAEAMAVGLYASSDGIGRNGELRAELA